MFAKEEKMLAMQSQSSAPRKSVLELVKLMLKISGLKPTPLSRKAGLAHTTVSKFLKEDATHTLSMTTLQKLSHASGVPISLLPEISQMAPFRHVPIISWVEAGQMTETHPAMELDGVDTIPVESNRDSLFALHVSGDSMDRIAPPDSIIIIDFEDRILVDRKYYVFSLQDKATVKQYRTEPARLEPVSNNPDHYTIFPEAGLEVIGKVIQIIIDV